MQKQIYSEKIKQFEKRKRDHISLSLSSLTQNISSSDYSRVGLIPKALPDFDFSNTDLSTKLLGYQFASPHFVSSMTAGHELGQKINLTLARAAAKNNWLMAVGSQRRELLHQVQASEWIKILNQNPDLKIVSNIGIEEVIQFEPRKILKLAKNIGALGLIVHLNPIQEVIQKNEALFKGSQKALRKLIDQSKLPIIIKEVGFGISNSEVSRFLSWGVHAVDISGRGGTHWGALESLRQPHGLQIRGFENWGLTNIEVLKSLPHSVLKKNIWASGGIRSGVDSLKCLAMGAKAVGVAQPLMKAVDPLKSKWVFHQAVEAVDQCMKQFDQELKVGLFGVGQKNLKLLNQSTFSSKKVWYEI